MTAKTGNKNTDNQNSFINDASGNVARNVVMSGTDSITIGGESGSGSILLGSSKMLYSSYQSTLDDADLIDSGYLDMSRYDKVQFSGSASVAGMTMTIYSRADDNQTPLETPTTYTDGTFYLFNVICRQRYMRFTWTNNTGSQVSNVSMEIKASNGSSDKLSVFPLNVQPSDFSQAALIQSVLRGRDQSGQYINVGVNEIGALQTSNFLLDVARGKYTNYKIDTKFGRNSDIDTSAAEDIWGGGGFYTGHNPTGNENITCSSSSTQDSGTLLSSGTATSGDTSSMTDSGATFISDGVAQGDLLINDTQGFHGVISSLTETTITVIQYTDGDIEIYTFNSGDSYRVATTNGNGAAVVKWTKILDEDYIKQSPAYIIMNGTTGVTYNVNAFRCSRGKVVLAGSTSVNVGQVTATQETTTANVFAVMESLEGQTRVCCDTVPAGKTYFFTNFKVMLSRASGAAGSADMSFQLRNVGESWQTKRSPTITNSVAYNPTINPDLFAREKTDIKWRAQSVSDNNTIISAEFEYVEIDNTVI